MSLSDIVREIRLAEIQQAITLKPCPFCGGHGRLSINPGNEMCTVNCETCEASGPVAWQPYQAAQMWNNRKEG